MQSDWNQIYKITANRTGKSEQFYKDLGNFVFAELYKNLRRPKSLIIKLRGVGYWYLRRFRMKTMVETFPPNLDRTEPLAFDQQNKIEMYHIFIERLKEYENYILDRDEIRRIKYGSETLLEPPNGEE